MFFSRDPAELEKDEDVAQESTRSNQWGEDLSQTNEYRAAVAGAAAAKARAKAAKARAITAKAEAAAAKARLDAVRQQLARRRERRAAKAEVRKAAVPKRTPPTFRFRVPTPSVPVAAPLISKRP